MYLGEEMEKVTLRNGVKLLYEYRPGQISSVCIGFNAGALEEGESFCKGTAHALEHVISKGTKKRNENDINNQFDRFFGFENAMTNYPYTIYYGTCLSQDLHEGIELYSDVILNATFPKKGFEEEMNIIFQELKEWKDNAYQYCEDLLFENSFRLRRIRETIIGNECSIKNITLDEIKRFYCKFYIPENCVICICSSLQFDYIHNLIENYFGYWKTDYEKDTIKFHEDLNILYEKNKKGIFVEKVSGIKGVKIQYIFDISHLNFREREVLKVFNAIFGQGAGSVLFNQIRTCDGLAYEVGSNIKEERGVKLFSIKIGTSLENIDKVIYIVNSVIDKFRYCNMSFGDEEISYKIKNVKLKDEIKKEKSVEFCKINVIEELMNDNILVQKGQMFEIKSEHINDIVDKFMYNPSIQILRG